MMSPSSAFSNCDDGISTFLLTPRMSVNCRRMKLTLNFSVSSRMSFRLAPAVSLTSALDLRGTWWLSGREEGTGALNATAPRPSSQ